MKYSSIASCITLSLLSSSGVSGSSSLRGLQEVEDCKDSAKKFKYQGNRISCADVALDSNTICSSSWKARKKCEACGVCVPEVEDHDEDHHEDNDILEDEDEDEDTDDEDEDEDTDDEDEDENEDNDSLNEEDEEESAEDCVRSSKKFMFPAGAGRKSCADVAADTSLCSFWKANNKCEACGNCVPDS